MSYEDIPAAFARLIEDIPNEQLGLMILHACDVFTARTSARFTILEAGEKDEDQIDDSVVPFVLIGAGRDGFLRLRRMARRLADQSSKKVEIVHEADGSTTITSEDSEAE